MSKYAKFNSDGLPQAFYDDKIHNSIPHGSVKITDGQWLELISNQGSRKWDGSAVVEYTAPAPTFTVVETIKSLAGKIILGIAPDYKQRNMTARAVEIADAKAQGTATEADIAESEAIRAVWDKIKAIRVKSNELEAQYLSLGQDLTAEDVDTIKAALEAEVE